MDIRGPSLSYTGPALPKLYTFFGKRFSLGSLTKTKKVLFLARPPEGISKYKNKMLRLIRIQTNCEADFFFVLFWSFYYPLLVCMLVWSVALSLWCVLSDIFVVFLYVLCTRWWIVKKQWLTIAMIVTHGKNWQKVVELVFHHFR